ncbi:MAG: fibronectin type III domain-containing protein, partial [Granulosicoccus sp.]
MKGLPGTSLRVKAARILWCLTIALVFEPFHSRELMAQDPPAMLRAQLVDQTVTLDWQASPGALGYNVYRDDAYLSTVASTGFSEPLSPGTVATYYVVAFSASPTLYSARSQTIIVPESAQPQDPTIPPTVPVNLTGEIDGSTVVLRWDASTDDEQVAGYNIYMDGQYHATVPDNQWQGSVEPGMEYAFSVVAFDIRRNFSIASDTLSLSEAGQQTDTTPPGVVENLTGSITGASDGVVELLWEAPTNDNDVAGYNVYRDDRYIATVFTESYADSVNAALVHEYYVVAFDFSSNFGNRSETLVLPIVDDDEGSEDTQAPSAPGELVAQVTNGNTLSLVWSASTDNRGVTGYNIYENNEYLTTVAGTRFEQPANSDEDVSYYVIAFDEARNFSPRSEEAGLSPAANQAPFFPDIPDVDAFAGETVSILLAPSDPDGTVPGMLIGSLPEGMVSEDNFDSTRTLTWRPLEPDVGSYT